MNLRMRRQQLAHADDWVRFAEAALSALTAQLRLARIDAVTRYDPKVAKAIGHMVRAERMVAEAKESAAEAQAAIWRAEEF